MLLCRNIRGSIFGRCAWGCPVAASLAAPRAWVPWAPPLGGFPWSAGGSPCKLLPSVLSRSVVFDSLATPDCGPPGSVCLLNWEAGSLALLPPGKPSSKPRCLLFSGVWVHFENQDLVTQRPATLLPWVLQLCPRSKKYLFVLLYLLANSLLTPISIILNASLKCVFLSKLTWVPLPLIGLWNKTKLCLGQEEDRKNIN